MTDGKMKKEHILVFEPLSGGHRAEFISHLLDHIRRASVSNRHYTFVVGVGVPDEEERIPCGVSLLKIDPMQEHALSRASGLLGGFVFWRMLKTYLTELKPDHLIIMDLTRLELALCFRRLPCNTSAILFVQYPELRFLTAPAPKDKLKFMMKELKTQLLLRNRMLRKIYLLNGAFSCAYLNERFTTDQCIPIPDPVLEITADPDIQLRREYGIEAGRCVFLFFGSMSARKGVSGLVKAIKSLSMEAAQKTAFIFCGLPESDYAQHYHERIENLVRERPDICLHRDERFVSSTRFRALFEQADWILMPYTRPEYSSGILAHAAAAATPVIGPADGLVGRQIREHGLGLDIHLEDLLKTLEKSMDENYVFDEPARQAFVTASNPKKFAEILLEV